MRAQNRIMDHNNLVSARQKKLKLYPLSMVMNGVQLMKMRKYSALRLAIVWSSQSGLFVCR